jgi:hypothetical protein
VGLKKKELEAMLRAAMTAQKTPSKYEQQYDAELGKMDDIIARKDFGNLPTEYAPDFHQVAEEKRKRDQMSQLHETGIGAWNSGDGAAMQPMKEFNTNLYLEGVRDTNDNAVKSFISGRNSLRSGLMGAAMDRNKDVLSTVMGLYQQKAAQPSFWGDVAKMAIGTGIKTAASFI